MLLSNLGGDAMGIWRLHKFGSNLGHAVGSVLLDRVIAMAALAMLVVIMLPFAFDLIEDKLYLTRFGLFAGAVGMGLVVILYLDRLARALRRLLPARVIDAVSALGQNARTVLLNARVGFAVLGLAVTN